MTNFDAILRSKPRAPQVLSARVKAAVQTLYYKVQGEAAPVISCPAVTDTLGNDMDEILRHSNIHQTSIDKTDTPQLS